MKAEVNGVRRNASTHSLKLEIAVWTGDEYGVLIDFPYNYYSRNECTYVIRGSGTQTRTCRPL